MAALKIRVTKQNASPVKDGPHAEFGTAGGTIGRGAGSTLMLDDPDRIISRTHASIVFEDGAFRLRAQGSAAPVMLNGQALGNGQVAPLRPGDELGIGRYLLRVEGEAASAALPAGSAMDLTMDGTVLSWSEDGAAGAAGGIRTLHVASPTEAAKGPAPGETAAVDATPAPVPPDTSGVTFSAASASTAPTAAEIPMGPLLQSFLTGAGVANLKVPGGLTPELMHTIGQMLRESVRGLLDLLAARASAKREVRADATVIVAKDNNPLKFAPGLEAALTHLLAPRGTGFMPPLRAVADANDSLRSHQVAFMAGMQAALASVLKRLDPAAIEHRTGQPSLVGSFMPGAHKARLWDQYVELHAAARRDASQDFRTLFGEEFLSAYQSKTGRLPDGDVQSHS